jgi:vancomycin resistance protein YoaR
VRVVRLAAFMRAEVGVEPARRTRVADAGRGRRTLRRAPWRAILYGVSTGVLVLIAIGVFYAGSPERIAAGVTVAGVDVGGMSQDEAARRLSAHAASVASVPVVFTAAGERWAVTPRKLDVRVDWRAAAERAVAAGDAPIVLRGLERLRIRLFGEDVAPAPDYYEPALRFQVARMAQEVDIVPREAALVLRGLDSVVVPAREGRRLDRAEARELVLGALAGFEREEVSLPVVVATPEVVASELSRARAEVEVALSAPVRIAYGDVSWEIRPRELATFLELPARGRTELRIGGPAATAYLRNLGRGVSKRPRSADFTITSGGRVRIVPAEDGHKLNVEATSKALLAVALSTTNREAELVVSSSPPRLTTDEAKALGIERVLASYSTLYSGTSDRIRNLQLAVEALDGTRIAPGGTFSFNRAVGPRTEERGYRPAPVIIDGEYKDGIGGGVSQVATTVFNAAWEAGVKITARTAHALYISRYPLGRDATVVYPDIDLRFQNDTGRWIFVRATYDDTGIAVSLLGAGRERRVVSRAGELRAVAPPKVEVVPDPNLFEGERVIVDAGEPARAVTVTRTVYAGGEVLYRETWSTSYRSEPRIVRVGTQAKPEPKPPKPPPVTTTTAPTTTAPTTTAATP